MAERVSEPTTGVVRAELIPALWRDSAALWLGISGEAPGPCSANIWHRVTDVSETSEGIAVSFDDGPDKILAADEQGDVRVSTDIGRLRGLAGWLPG
ncbi:hypothetical protein [Mycobacterium avium]|uniref:hypothetical protein n=1 Tax=Mycobacterium avium TaxID=1764 RepID=UPI001156DCA2|nr:hypothetical protein [Mycobacterium avium]